MLLHLNIVIKFKLRYTSIIAGISCISLGVFTPCHAQTPVCLTGLFKGNKLYVLDKDTSLSKATVYIFSNQDIDLLDRFKLGSDIVSFNFKNFKMDYSKSFYLVWLNKLKSTDKCMELQIEISKFIASSIGNPLMIRVGDSTVNLIMKDGVYMYDKVIVKNY